VWQWFRYGGPLRWPGRTVARRLGISHTYVQKLVREFSADLSRMERQQQGVRLVTFIDLHDAQEQTKRERERGVVRYPCDFAVREFQVLSNVVRAVVRTKAAEARASAKPKIFYGEGDQVWGSPRFAPQCSFTPRYAPVLSPRRMARRHFRPGQIGWNHYPWG
jgi:hypothetical protein